MVPPITPEGVLMEASYGGDHEGSKKSCNSANHVWVIESTLDTPSSGESPISDCEEGDTYRGHSSLHSEPSQTQSQALDFCLQIYTLYSHTVI